jgi:hypothetical protein
MKENMDRSCLSCSKPLKGRSDKKFCNDYCRNVHNNQLRSGNEAIVKQINHALSKNRRILEQLLGGHSRVLKAKKETLLLKGFEFRYSTHQSSTKKGKLYNYCYDHGYHMLNAEECLLLKDSRPKISSAIHECR